MQTIGTTFKNIREERNLLLEELTKSTGISKAVLSRIENGKRLPTREQVNQLCKYYKAERNEIIVQWLSDKLVYLGRFRQVKIHRVYPGSSTELP